MRCEEINTIRGKSDLLEEFLGVESFWNPQERLGVITCKFGAIIIHILGARVLDIPYMPLLATRSTPSLSCLSTCFVVDLVVAVPKGRCCRWVH